MSSISAIGELTKTTNADNTASLGKDEFLSLLVTQLKYQDPLDPMKNEAFIAQLAQFSTLESMKNMEDSFQGSTAYSLIGKLIVAREAETGKETEGIVSGIKSKAGIYYAIIPSLSTSVKKEDALQAFAQANLRFDQFKLKLFTPESLSAKNYIWKSDIKSADDFIEALGYSSASEVPTSLKELWDGNYYKEVNIDEITQVYENTQK